MLRSSSGSLPRSFHDSFADVIDRSGQHIFPFLFTFIYLFFSDVYFMFDRPFITVEKRTQNFCFPIISISLFGVLNWHLAWTPINVGQRQWMRIRNIA